MNELLFLLPAFIACLMLTGIHTYLGIHVITREVIFVDIALAQIAALGMSVAFWMGFEPEAQITYFFGLGFTFVAALFFAFFRNPRLPQEALIGVSFAVSSALGILLADKIPHGSEHLKHVLAGNILWVGWAEILKTTVIYGTLGVLHFLIRKKLMLISQDPEKARRQGIKVKLWDLVFYLSFGIVITSSVQIGGVLLVFSFLIVPALSAMLFYDGLRARVFLGWVLGGTVSLAGITASYFYDLPTGPAIVATFGAALGICFAVKRIFNLRAPT